MLCLAVLVAALAPLRPHVSPSWVVAFERDNDIWTERADGTRAKRLVKNGSLPKWSPDGKMIAFVRARSVMVYDLARHRERRAFRFSTKEEPDPQETYTFIDWDPKRPALLTATDNSDRIHLVNLSADASVLTSILGQWKSLPTFAPRWSPSGRWLAFVRGGDIWVAERGYSGGSNSPMGPDTYTDTGGITRGHPIVPGAPRDNLYAWFYYTRANRVSATGDFNDMESGRSAATPYWAWELAWTRDESRLYFDFRRFGGSNPGQMGYLSLRRVKPGDEGDGRSDFLAVQHWLPGSDVWTPRICPDGQTLSFVQRDSEHDRSWLVVSDPNGHQVRKLLLNVWNPDWRPR